MDGKCFFSYKKVHTQGIIIRSSRYATGCKQVQLKKGKHEQIKSMREEVQEEEPATWGNWG